ncbi:MAG TPA: AMP-binding protein [Casimicrobiaceae bacterium]|nr:AMP-binding protein [Casimicrobiaceae bacterium]
MAPDDTTLIERPAQGAAEQRLLQLITDMLRELRPGAPPRRARLDDSIERDLALDSLSRAELLLRIERGFGVRLPERMAAAARTPRDLLRAIAVAEVGASALPLPPPGAPPPEPVGGTPEEAGTIVEAFRWHLERHPDRAHITLLERDEVRDALSYAELWRSAGEVARGLTLRGVRRGDAVALMLPTCRAFFEAFVGAMRIGAVPVPMYPPLRWSEIEEHVRGRAAILANAQARVLVTVPEGLFIGRLLRAQLPDLVTVTSVDRLREHGEPAEPPGVLRAGDTALLQYTSGSTGDPKGVVLSHGNLLSNLRVMGRAAAVTSNDRFLSWLPLYHDMGLIGAWLGTMYYAVPLVLMSPTDFLARPARWLRSIHRFGATISAGPNFAYEIAASKVRDEDLAGLDLSAWRLAFNGAEPVRAATLERFAARFARYGFDRRALTPVYGLAESTLGLGFPPLDRGPRVDRIDASALARDGRAVPVPPSAPQALEVVSCGRPLPGYEVRVVDEADREVAARAEGRLEFRGPSATSGYFRNPKATAALFHGDWLDTGDIGYVAEGEIFLTSRAKDLIKRGGHNLHPYDLEAAIGDVAGIRKGCIAVFGTTDAATGTERVVVVAETNQTDSGSRAALRGRIAALAAVHLGGPADEVLLVPARTVLKTSSGKIRRAACRDLYEKGLLEAPRHAVWLQLARLVGRAAAARCYRALRALGETGYGVHCWLLFVLVSLAGLPVLAILRRESARMRLARAVATILMRGCGLPVTVTGLEDIPPRGPAVIAANHSSYLDAMILTALLPPRVHFAAKREFLRVPVIGWVMRRLGAYFVERVDPARGVEDTRDVLAAASRGETVAFFPEGTFARAPGLLSFRLGAFVVAAESGTPVVPIVLRGTRSALREGRWLLARYPIEVIVQPPVVPSGRDWSAAVRLRDQVRAAMLRDCGEPDLGADDRVSIADRREQAR